MRYGSAVGVHLFRFHNLCLPVPMVELDNRICMKVCVAARDKEKKKEHAEDEKVHTLRQWRIESENEPMLGLAGLSPDITRAQSFPDLFRQRSQGRL